MMVLTIVIVIINIILCTVPFGTAYVEWFVDKNKRSGILTIVIISMVFGFIKILTELISKCKQKNEKDSLTLLIEGLRDELHQQTANHTTQMQQMRDSLNKDHAAQMRQQNVLIEGLNKDHAAQMQQQNVLIEGLRDEIQRQTATHASQMKQLREDLNHDHVVQMKQLREDLNHDHSAETQRLMNFMESHQHTESTFEELFHRWQLEEQAKPGSP